MSASQRISELERQTLALNARMSSSAAQDTSVFEDSLDEGSLVAPEAVNPKRIIVQFPSGNVVFKTPLASILSLKIRMSSFLMNASVAEFLIGRLFFL